jgi:DHA1 family tetracycline resistance protein-like MFS transporter
MSTTVTIDSESPENPSPPPKSAMRTLALITLTDMFGFGVIIPALPFYALAYKATAFQVGLIFALFSICQFFATPILGIWSDRRGRRPVLMISQAGSATGYLLLAIVTLIDWPSAQLALFLIYLSRIIDGISAGNISTAQAYVSDITGPKDRAKGMGLLGAAFGIGFALGPAAGGVLAHFHVSFPALSAALLSAAAMLLTYLYLPETRTHRPATEGVLLLDPRRLLFVFRNSTLLQLMILWFLSMGAFVMMETTIALFLARSDTFRFEELQVGLTFALAGLMIIVVQGGLIGPLTTRFGEWHLAIAGPVLVAMAMGLFVWTGYQPLLSVLIVAIIANSVGRSLQGPSMSSLVSKTASPEHQGATFGLYHAISSSARAIFPLVGTLIYATHPTGAFILAAAMVTAVAVWTSVLRIRRSEGVAPEPVGQTAI